MSTIKDSLQFHQSPYTVTDHAAEADTILEACAREFPALVPYLLQPSNLLAIGGFRGVSPYANFDPHDKLVKSSQFTAFLQRFGLRLIEEHAHYSKEPRPASYLLIHTGAFEAIPNLYHGAKGWWTPVPRQYDYLNYIDWYTYNVFECEMQMEKDKLPAAWLANWWAPHHVCFGMLLGYPGVAISSLVASDMVYKTLGVPPDMEQVEFKYPKHKGMSVEYEIQKTDDRSKQIAEHGKRWQAFFDMVYEAWPAGRVRELAKK